MNDNDKWSTLFSDELVSRGYNYLSSSIGAGHGNQYMCNALKNQNHFIKPALKHNETFYDVKYNYYNTAYKTNDTALSLYITSQAADTSSTDVTISSTRETNFNLGYNGILSGSGLTNYIESVDTTDTTGRPFWQRFFFVSIKGGYNASNSYNVTTQKTNTKLCTFDQNTGLENETNPYLNSIPLKYKKLRTDVYLVQDDNFKSFKTYPTLGYSVLKRIGYMGSVYYYNGSPQSNDMDDQEYWTSSVEGATHFSTEPDWLTVEEKQQYEADHTCSLLFTADNDEYSVKISLPVVMNTTTATFWMEQLYYITANNNYVYTGTNNVADYTTGHWTDKIYSFYSADDPVTFLATPESIKFYNRQGDFVEHFNPSYFMNVNEISYELSDTSKYKWVLYYRGGYSGYWVSGFDTQATYSENLTNDVQVFATSADAYATRERFNSNIPDIAAIDSNKTNKTFFNYEYKANMQATMFSSYNDANNIINKMYQEDPDDIPPGATSVGVYINGNESYYTYYLNNNCPTAGKSYVEIPQVKWLSLNYFFKL